MGLKSFFKFAGVIVALGALTACGSLGRIGSPATERPEHYSDPTHPRNIDTTNTIWNAFNRKSNETEVLVNRYIWQASLEVLDFLPVQTVDPFTGVIVTGYGTPPGGGQAYRATVLIKDPALDARSLNVALQNRGGPASAATTRAIEDAILTRARQLRITDNRL
ncbi:MULTISPECIES: DUF3576 domain-containing protein [Roseobacteraceae]|jgi:hypothetical protein|uniref:DUF3576 domain-containing protein n=1 Tax=Pseudosulfitobacter pseudonitzschiae TaxID=1402135 RepID=A0A221K4E4_9RHOB|nr:MULTISPECIES: DUF3576 domain-containing protein [Roseobacteraceae]ASM73750.1 hypothetical protein SULPSESMR1_02969 [Pseudosulfitobacter pseudonitzschiae]